MELQVCGDKINELIERLNGIDEIIDTPSSIHKNEIDKRNKIIHQLQLYLIETMSWDDCDVGCSDFQHTTACGKRSVLKLKIKDYFKLKK